MSKEAQLSKEQREQVHQFVFLANENPKLKVGQLIDLFQLTVLESNVALWRAQDLGYLFINDDTGEVRVETLPEKFYLGDEVERLKTDITLMFKKLGEKEHDLNEEDLSALWVQHIPTHLYAIAMKLLLSEKVIASYEITNKTELPLSKKAKAKGKEPKVVEDTYVYYSLWDNAEQQWGRKRHPDQSRIS